MAKEKYYGTNLIGLNIPIVMKDKFKVRNSHNQFRVVCKSTSMNKANEIFKEITGYSFKVFQSNNTMETGNQTEIQNCDKDMFIIRLDDHFSGEYYSLQYIIDELKVFKEQIK